MSATIAGADDFVEATLWGTQHLAFLKRFYRYESGIPSHDTLCDVFAALDPELFKACFLAWINGLRDGDPDIIAVDGKTARRSHDRRKGRNPLHLVSAWAARQRIVLGQQATEEKSNEITAIPLLLQHLDLKGALVTMDAMGTQTDIARAIRDGGGDYCMSLKKRTGPPCMPMSSSCSLIHRAMWRSKRMRRWISPEGGSKPAGTRSAARSTG